MATLSRCLAALALLCSAATWADTGMTQLPATGEDGPITVFYPSSSAAAPLQRGPFQVRLAWQGTPMRGNGRLVVISHGSGAHPLVQADLAQALVEAGFIVALPEHVGDNWHDHALVGPRSWVRRPQEVSRSIDAMARDPRFAALFDPQRVGVYGMSAGGHTALSMAGGRWSRGAMLAHCEANLAQDFAACTGAASELRGNAWDGLKLAIALPLIRWNLRSDDGWQAHTDERVRAVVAGVPFAADFDPASLAAPRVPLGIVQAEQDRWLVPRFHSRAVLAACPGCELLASLPTGGHGALLAPLPPPEDSRIGRLLTDPPGFDRATLPALYERITRFFQAHLLP